MNVDPLCPQQHTHPKHNPNRCIFCEYGAAVRVDALQAARDAVAAIPHWDEDSGESLFRACDKDDALAAIDALHNK